MTCVRIGSLVEMTDELHNIWLQPIETLSPGDHIRDPVNDCVATLSTVVVYETGGMWPMIQYMGLTSDFTQLILVTGQQWMKVSDIGIPSLQLCPRIYSLVLKDGRTATVDGVICNTYNPSDFINGDNATQVDPPFLR